MFSEPGDGSFPVKTRVCWISISTSWLTDNELTIISPIRLITPMAENIRPRQILRKLIIIPVFIQPFPQNRYINGQEKSLVARLCKFILLTKNTRVQEYKSKWGRHTLSPLQKLYRNRTIPQHTHLHHIWISRTLTSHIFEGVIRIRR